MKTKCEKHGCDYKVSVRGRPYCPACTDDEVSKIEDVLRKNGFEKISVHSETDCQCPRCTRERAEEEFDKRAEETLGKVEKIMEKGSPGGKHSWRFCWTHKKKFIFDLTADEYHCFDCAKESARVNWDKELNKLIREGK